MNYPPPEGYGPQPPPNPYAPPGAPIGPPYGYPPYGDGGEPNVNIWLPFVLSGSSLFCCGIFCIVPLIFAIIAAVQNSNRNYNTARTMARVANIIGGVFVGLGALVWIGYIALFVIGSM